MDISYRTFKLLYLSVEKPRGVARECESKFRRIIANTISSARRYAFKPEIWSNIKERYPKEGMHVGIAIR